MPNERRNPRPIVPGLQGNSLIPAADPSRLDNYNRPGSPEIYQPDKTNPFLKLADSLSSLSKDLQPIVKQVSEQMTKEEEAKLVSDFQLNREKWNTAVRNGEIPLGASPHAARAVKRLMLSELADDFSSRTSLAFSGEAGAVARESNDPRVMRQFLDQQQQQFYREHLKNGDRELYAPLDIQETFTPKVEKASSDLMRAHAHYRVQETERELIDTVGASVSRTIEDTFTGMDALTPDEERTTRLQEAGKKIAATLYDPDYGAVKNGLNFKRGGDLLVDTITARAVKMGDRSVLDLLDHVKHDKSIPLGVTQYAQQKRLQAEEHLISLQIQQENHAWQLEQRPYQRASLQRQAEDYRRQDERYDKERAEWATGKAEHEIARSLTRRLYEGLDHTDSKRGVAIINEVLRDAKQSLPEKVESFNQLLHAVHQRKAHVEDDKTTVAKIYQDIRRDPLGFDAGRLTRAVEAGTLSVNTMRGIDDDLDRKRNNASHPFMRQPEIHEMIQFVSRGALQSPGDEFSAEGALRMSNAIGSFRDRATTWINKNPQGTMEEFTEHMRDQVAPILERVNKEYAETQQKDRAKQEALGRQKVSETQGQVLQREVQRAKEDTEREALRDALKRETELRRLQGDTNQTPTGPLKEYQGNAVTITPQHLRTLLTGDQKRELADLRDRVLRPGVKEKPLTEEHLKDRVMEMLKPIYKEAGASPSELADGVSQFMRVLLPSRQSPAERGAKSSQSTRTPGNTARDIHGFLNGLERKALGAVGLTNSGADLSPE